MLRSLMIFLIGLGSWTAGADEEGSRLLASMGLGLFSRMDREVNPDFYELRHVPELYGKLRYARWGLILEVGHEEQESASGAMSITHESTMINTWGRYDLDQNASWAPFATAGVGLYMDQVTSSYGSASDERSGRRGLFGLGAGLAGIFLKRVEVELEGRLGFIQDRKDPQMAALFRVGYRLPN